MAHELRTVSLNGKTVMLALHKLPKSSFIAKSFWSFLCRNKVDKTDLIFMVMPRHTFIFGHDSKTSVYGERSELRVPCYWIRMLRRK